MTIYKYVLPQSGHRVTVEIHGGVVAKSVGIQPPGNIVVWAFVDPGAPLIPCIFHQMFTGQSVPDIPTTFIGTVQAYDGLVFHVFQEVR